MSAPGSSSQTVCKDTGGSAKKKNFFFFGVVRKMRDFHLFCKIKEISFILPINEISFILRRGFEIDQNAILFFLGGNAIWHCVLLNAICKYCTGKQIDTRTCADPRAVQRPLKSENNVMVSPARILVAVCIIGRGPHPASIRQCRDANVYRDLFIPSSSHVTRDRKSTRLNSSH